MEEKGRKTRKNQRRSAFYSQEKKSLGQTAEVTFFVIIVPRLLAEEVVEMSRLKGEFLPG